MNYVLLVHVVECQQDLFDNAGCFSLRQPLLLNDVVIQLTPSDQFRHDVKLSLVLQQLKNPDYVGMIGVLQHL